MKIENISELINNSLNFTKGWKISEEEYNDICTKVAKKIHKSFERREKNFLKELKQLQNLITAGNSLANVAYNFKQHDSINESFRQLFERYQLEWDKEKEKTFKIRNKIFNNK